MKFKVKGNMELKPSKKNTSIRPKLKYISNSSTIHMELKKSQFHGIHTVLQCPDIKGILHRLPKISMFCALSQNYQHLLW